MADREKAFTKALAAQQARVTALFGLIKDEDKARVRSWEEDEKPSLEQLVSSLNQTREIVKKEKKRLAADLTAKAEKEKYATPAGVGRSSSMVDAAGSRDTATLQRRLIELQSRLACTDVELKGAHEELAKCDRAAERDYLSTKCVVLQDTRRILEEEVGSLQADLARIESSVRVEQERRRAEESGWAQVARLEETLERTTTRLDLAKQQLYFPEAKGFRFSSGSGGLYLAARDLHLSEVSGRFEFYVEPIRHRAASTTSSSAGGAAGAGGSKGSAAPTTKLARLTVVLGGVSGTGAPERAEGRHSSAQDTSFRGGAAGSSAGGAGGRSSGGATNGSGGNAADQGSWGIPAPGRGAGGAGPLAEGVEDPPRRSDGGGQDGSSRPSTSGGGAGAAGTASGAPPVAGAGAGEGMSVRERAAAMAAASSAPTGSPGGGPAGAAAPHGSAGSPGPPRQQHPQPPRPQSSPLDPFNSQPAPSTAPLAAPLHRRTTSQEPHLGTTSTRGTAAQGGPAGRQGAAAPPLATTSYSPLTANLQGAQHAAGGVAHGGIPHMHPSASVLSRSSGGGAGGAAAGDRSAGKGEGVANFLSSLKHKKDQLKAKLAGDRSAHGGVVGVPSSPGGFSGVGPGGLSPMPSGESVGGSPRPTGRLGEMRSKMSAAAAEMKDKGMQLKDKMADKLQDGLSESKGKLSRVARAIADKAPGALQGVKDKLRTGSRGGLGAYPDELGGLGGYAEGDVSELGSGAYGLGGMDGVGSVAGEAAGLDAPRTWREEQPHRASSVPPAGAAARGGGGGGSAGGSPAEEAAGVPKHSASAQSLDSEGGSETMDPEDPLLGGFVEDFECRPSRKGVYMQLLGERVELLGERGTKVPDMSIREFMMEVEVAVTATFEYHTSAGAGGGGAGGGAWLAPEPVAFNILQLDHRMRGNNIPLPRSLLKGLLNAYMPSMLTRVLSALLPAELGAYTAGCGESQTLSGEFKVAGPSLSTTVTSIAPAPKMPSDPAKRAKWQAAQAAAARARAMLGLSAGQAAAVAELFGGCGRASLVPESAGVAPSISGLCRFYTTYKRSGLWPTLVEQLDRALKDAFDFHGVPPAQRFALHRFFEGPVARLVRKPLRIAFSIERLSLALDCDTALATLRDFFERLAREFEAKSAKAQSEAGAGGPPREPLEVQLELLDLWHAGLAKMLRTFKAKFRSAGGALLATADRDVFQVGVESVAYDGPLRLKVPLDLAIDPGDGSFFFDIRLPDREQASHSITSLLTEVMYSLSTTHNASAAAAGSAAQTAAVAAAAAATAHAAEAALAAGTAVPSGVEAAATAGLTPPSQASLAKAVAARSAAVQGLLDAGSGGGAAGGAGDSPRGGSELPAVDVGAAELAGALEIGSEWTAEPAAEAAAAAAPVAAAVKGTPLLLNPVVGQLSIKKLALNLTLDEERLVQLLANTGPHPTSSASALPLPGLGLPTAASLPSGSSPGGISEGDADIASRLLSCFGHLFTASLDTGWRPTSEADGAPQKPCCMLTVANNDITRVRAHVEGLWFQSSVSPRLAVRVLQAVVLAVILKFHAADSYSIRFWNKAFGQITEYLGRGSLDVAICLSLRATMDRAKDRLRVELSGQDLNAHAGHGQGQGQHGGAGAGGAGEGLLGRVCPVYLLNDVNLLTVLDTVKLLSEGGGAGQQHGG